MTLTPLSTRYPCKQGGPVLTHVDKRIFTFRYFRHCLSCNFCHDACCQHGVDIDLSNAARLKSLPEKFKATVPTPVEDWFTTQPSADSEFPSGQYVRTQTRNGGCVFLDTQNRGCRIHRYCLEEGLDYHILKPMVSTLFPLTFEHGALIPSSEVLDGSLICSGTGPSCYDGARDELSYYFSDVLVLELDRLSNAQ